jgi:hypothetical protein
MNNESTISQSGYWLAGIGPVQPGDPTQINIIQAIVPSLLSEKVNSNMERIPLTDRLHQGSRLSITQES